MLNITILKNTIYFNDLTDELYDVIKGKYPKLQSTPKGNYRIQGTPKDLYYILVDLSYTYDIEIY